MKAEHISFALELEQLPNVGRKTARLLRDIGVCSPADLAAENSYLLYDKICQVTHQSHDLRLLDILLSAADFIQGNSPRHWSEFSEQRRQKMQFNKREKPDG